MLCQAGPSVFCLLDDVVDQRNQHLLLCCEHIIARVYGFQQCLKLLQGRSLYYLLWCQLDACDAVCRRY